MMPIGGDGADHRCERPEALRQLLQRDPSRAILLEAPEDRVRELDRRIRPGGEERRGRVGGHAREHGRDALALEGHARREQLVEHHAERPDVGRRSRPSSRCGFCSGDMYVGEPNTAWVSVSFGSALPESGASFEIPKSRTLGTGSRPTAARARGSTA